MSTLRSVLAGALCVALAMPTSAQVSTPSAPATTATPASNQAAKTFPQAELDQLLAPIALYPDSLLAQVLMASTYPLDIVRAIRLSKATVRKMKQNLFWASIYNVLAIPVAAGALYPSFGIELRPEWSALLMSLSSIIVATNAVLLKTVDKGLDADN